MKKSLLLFTLFVISFSLTYSVFEKRVEYHRKVVKGNNKLYPSDWGYQQRVSSEFGINPEAIAEALQQASALKKEQTSKLNKGASIPNWEFAGPVNIGGRVSDIEFNPKNPSIVYAGASTGGVFKSEDMGETWSPIFDELACLSIGDIGIDPSNPEVIYAGTGEANGGHNNFPGIGIFKSTNAGNSWEFSGLAKSYSVSRIIVHPANSNIVYASVIGNYFGKSTERGIFKSTDAGNTWNKTFYLNDSTGAIDLIMKPDNPDFLMCAMWNRQRTPYASYIKGPASGIYYSTNAGETWTRSVSVLPQDGLGRIGIGVSKSEPNTVYAMTTDGTQYNGFYKSTDFGKTWVAKDPYREIGSGTSTFSWYFGQVRVHPTQPNTVYALDVAFMRSTDGGATWPISYGYNTDWYAFHVDHHALAFHPTNPNYLISGNDGGINISTDAGVTWSLPKFLPCTQFYEIGLDYTNPHRLYGGTQDNNTIRTHDGSIDNWERILGGDGFYVAVDPTDPDIIYAESQYGGFAYTTDGGLVWNHGLNGITYTDPFNWSTPFIMDPTNPKTLYLGTNKVYKTTNGAQSWTLISPKLTITSESSRLGTITTLSASKLNSNVIWAGTADAQVWVTTNGGSNWSNVKGGLPDRWVTRVFADPHAEGTAYATYSGLKWNDPIPHIFKTTDYGSDWIDITGNLPNAPVNTIAVDLLSPEIIYVGTDVGAYVSFNGGQSWEILGKGLPTVSVYDMKIHPTENYLAVGTHGRSMYRLDLSLVDVKPDANELNNFVLKQNYPNPFNPNTNIEFTLPVSGNVELKIFNLNGEEVKTIINAELGRGIYKYTVDLKDKPSGIYFYRLKTAHNTVTKKMVLIK